MYVPPKLRSSDQNQLFNRLNLHARFLGLESTIIYFLPRRLRNKSHLIEMVGGYYFREKERWRPSNGFYRFPR